MVFETVVSLFEFSEDSASGVFNNNLCTVYIQVLFNFMSIFSQKYVYLKKHCPSLNIYYVLYKKYVKTAFAVNLAYKYILLILKIHFIKLTKNIFY